MKKLLFILVLVLSSSISSAQIDILSKFNATRDSIFNKQNEYRNYYDKYKEIDIKKADYYSELSNKCFSDAQNLVLEYVDKCADNENIIKLLDRNIFMFEINYKSASQLIAVLEKHKNFDEKLTARAKSIYQKLSNAQMVGKVAPNFSLFDINGKQVSLSDFKGKMVWVSFWASWCSPCRAKNRVTVELYDELLKKGVVVVSISLDETEKLWLEATEKDKICWYSLRDTVGFKNSILKESYKVTSLPTTFLIDKSGKVVLQNPSANDVLNHY